MGRLKQGAIDQPLDVKASYIIGKIHDYMREYKINKPPKKDMRKADFVHQSLMRSACEKMMDAVINFGPCRDYCILFEVMIDKYDCWACCVKEQWMSYTFSTVRDVLYDLYDYVKAETFYDKKL